MEIKIMLHNIRDKRKQYKAADALVNNNMRYVEELKKDRVTQATIDRAFKQLEEAISARDVIRNECAELETTLASAINELDDIRERNVMYAMYVLRLSARAIAQQMHYCQSFIWQCRKSAIDKLSKLQSNIE